MTYARGFTIIELVIAIGLSSLFFGLSLMGISHLSKRLRVSPADTGIIHVLSTAALQARLGEEESAWGVYFPYDEESRLADHLILFSGENYATRNSNKDIFYPISSTITFQTVSLSGAGISEGNDHEVVFHVFSGSTENYGSIMIEVYNEQRTVVVSKQGFITREYE